MKIFITTILIVASIQAFAQNKKAIKPINSVAKVILKGQKEYTYFGLSEKAATSYKVTGPGVLHVNYRVRLPENAFSSEKLHVRYTRSDDFLDTHTVPSILAGNLHFKNKNLKGNPSRAHKETIIVPPGEHVFKFYKHKSDQKVHVRAFYEQHEKPIWKDLTPMNEVRAKKLRYIKTGKEIEYFEISKKEPFRFKSDDSSRIRVIVRPEFSYKMLSETILKIYVTNMNSGEKKVFKMNSSKSSKIEFIEDVTMTPGNSNTFYVDLPASSDEYEIGLNGGAKSAVIRVSSDQNLKSYLP